MQHHWKTYQLSQVISDVWERVVLNIILPQESRRKETQKPSPTINLIVKG